MRKNVDSLKRPLSRFEIKDWRISLGLILTFVWLLAWISVALWEGWDAFWGQELGRLGGLEGLFAPLAFLWLVLGLFIQQKELSVNTQTLQQSNRQAAEQTRVLAETELRARQAAFFQILDSVSRSTGTLLGYMISQIFGPDGQEVYSEEQLATYWSAHGAGEYERFPLIILADELASEEFFFGNEVNAGWSEDVIKNLRNILALARDCDDDKGTIHSSVTRSSLAYVYVHMLRYVKAPSAWVMFDDSQGFINRKPNVSVAGTWHSIDRPEMDNEPFRLLLRQSSDGHVSGTVIGEFGTLDVDYGFTEGDRLILRFFPRNLPLIATATLEGDQMQGTVHGPEGVLWNYIARRDDTAGETDLHAD